MSLPEHIAAGETGYDHVLRFSIPGRNARGRMVRLGPVVDEVLDAHAYPPPIRRLLAETLALTALLGSLLKDDGSQMTMQAQTEAGVVDLLVCDYRNGDLRGYARFDAERLAMLGPNPTLYALFGQGYLAVTFDMAASGQRYQGIVPLEGESMAAACETYFAQSEQVPTLIRVGVGDGAAGCSVGGLLVQHLAEGEDGRERLHAKMDHPEWEHVAVLGGSVRAEELVDPDLSLEALVWRLFHEEDEVRVVAGERLRKGCRCSIEHYRDVLAKFPENDRIEMQDERGIIAVDCAFCSKVFEIDT